jgi:hypothetical protein
MITIAREKETEENTHLLTLQRRIGLALVLFADDTKFGKVAQLRVDGELAEFIVGLDEEICRVCTGCDPVPQNRVSAVSQRYENGRAHWKISKSSNVSTWTGFVALLGLSSPIPSSPLTAF